MILPTSFEIERHHEKGGLQVTSVKEEWEIITEDQVDQDSMASNTTKPLVGSIAVSHAGEEARATVVVHPQSEGRQHVELNAMSVSAGA